MYRTRRFHHLDRNIEKLYYKCSGNEDLLDLIATIKTYYIPFCIGLFIAGSIMVITFLNVNLLIEGINIEDIDAEHDTLVNYLRILNLEKHIQENPSAIQKAIRENSALVKIVK